MLGAEKHSGFSNCNTPLFQVYFYSNHDQRLLDFGETPRCAPSEAPVWLDQKERALASHVLSTHRTQNSALFTQH